MKFSHAILLALVIALLLVANSADFLFHQAYHPVWDSAANGLSVLRAKHFAQVYGPYSRWGFYHPGPALFYVQAFGEWLFHDVLGWVRAPFAGQTLAHVAVMSGFFVAALGTFSRWTPAGRRRWWFCCGALALAIPHFTLMGRIPSYDVLRGPSAFLSTWSAHALVLPFVCLLTTGASVAAGRGEDLPTLALSGGYLLHLHVAQPMFVLPAFAVGYAGLLWQVRRQVLAEGGRWAAARPGGWRRLPGRAWRVFPRAHSLALATLVLFAVPLVLDLCRGRESNVARILDHLHRYDTHKSLGRACFYFLMFGAYTAYNPLDNEFAAFDRAGFLAFLRAHAGLLALWAAVAAVAVGTLLRGPGRAWRRRRGAAGGNVDDGGTRFRAWAAGFWLMAVALTLRWNVRQDEEMFYFNAWFTFAIYGFGAVIALATVCGDGTFGLVSGESWRGGRNAGNHRRGPSRREQLAGVLAVLAVAAWHADGLRWRDPAPEATRAMGADIQELVTETTGTPPRGGGKDGDADAVKMLCFEYNVSPVAGAVALRLARDGRPFFTVSPWAIYLGEEHGWDRFPEQTLRGGRFETWRFAHRSGLTAEPTGVPDRPVTLVPYLQEFFQAPDDIVVRRSAPPVDPAADGGAGTAVRFGPGGDAARYAVGGWFTADNGQVWMDDPRALLGFRPVPVAGGDGTVEISLVGLTSVVTAESAPSGTRLQVFLDGEPLGGATALTRPEETLRYRVPAAEWDRQTAAPGLPGRDRHLLLELPDAISETPPHLPKPPSQRAPIGLALREVRFRWVPSEPPISASAGP